MPYLGNEPGAITDAFTQTFTGNGSTTNFTLQQASTTNAVFVRVSGVMQRNGTDFTVSGTTLAFTTAPPDLANNIVVQFFTLGSVQEIAADAVTVDKLNLVSTASVPSLEAKGDGSSQDGYIQLNCSQNSHGIKLKAPPHSAGQSYTLTYPSAIVNGGFLKTDGSGNLSFATPTAGGLRFISTTDISNAANYSFTSFDSSSFAAYLFVLINVTPASDAVNLDMFTSTDGGSTYDSGSSDYNWTFNRGTVYGSDSGDDGDADADDDSISLTCNNSGGANVVGSDANEHGVSGQIWMYNPASTKITHGTYDLMYQANTPENLVNIAKGGYARMSAADVDAIRLSFSSGNIETGTINAYGVVNA